ncbi:MULTISPECIES: hypothetical protein [unclassified Microbulbifer]|uniref:hypothetical protein n=1 Tax=unclassified Microbulbifer TaxID=2619833 RepID=UPI0027E3F1FF|nr:MULTISPECIES: hypothetical protein [unclassified Microbulbifer]
MKITLPARRDYRPEPAPLETLPFVYRPGRGNKKAKRSNWKLPPVDDYGLACDLGREYAAHFVQYLKDNPFWVGKNLLGHILADIDYQDSTAAKGCHVGFFSHLERLLYAQAARMDVFDDVDRLRWGHADTLTEDTQ